MQFTWRRTFQYLALAGILLPLTAVAGPPDRGGPGDRERGRDIAPGTLVIPGRDEPGREDAEDKQCMKVCIRWGEDCIINPRTGVRQCRRSCREFGEQCF